MAFIIESGNFPNDPFGPPNYGSWLSKAAKKVKKATKTVSSAASGIVKPAIATAKLATGVTMLQGAVGLGLKAVGAKKPASFLLKGVKKDIPQIVKGYAIGAAVGGAIAGGGGLAKIVTESAKSATPIVSPSAPPAEATTTAASLPAISDEARPTAKSSVVGPVTGAGLGFLLLGPIGAAVGLGAGLFLAKK